MMEGTGFATVKSIRLEVPPPGAGVNTVTGMTAALARSESGIVMCSLFGLIRVALRVVVPNLTVAPDVNPEPMRSSDTPDSPARTLVRDIEDRTGVGFTGSPPQPNNAMNKKIRNSLVRLSIKVASFPAC